MDSRHKEKRSDGRSRPRSRSRSPLGARASATTTSADSNAQPDVVTVAALRKSLQEDIKQTLAQFMADYANRPGTSNPLRGSEQKTTDEVVAPRKSVSQLVAADPKLKSAVVLVDRIDPPLEAAIRRERKASLSSSSSDQTRKTDEDDKDDSHPTDDEDDEGDHYAANRALDRAPYDSVKTHHEKFLVRNLNVTL